MSTEREYVNVVATVTAPGLDPQRVELGSYPADALPLPAEWKKAYRVVAFDQVCHYPHPGDGYRVSFKSHRMADA